MEGENTIRGEDSFITRYDLKDFVKVASASAHAPFGEFNSSAKGFKPPGTDMVRERVGTMTLLRPAVYCASLEAHGDLSKIVQDLHTHYGIGAKGRMTDKNDYAGADLRARREKDSP